MSKLMLRAVAAFSTALAAPHAIAQTPPSAVVAPARVAKPALWVVRDADTTIYLFGTIHIMKPGTKWFDGAVRTAFDASGELVLEVVEPEPAAMQALVMAKAIDPKGRSLLETIPKDRRPAYLAALGGLNVPQAALDKFEPWFAATTLATLPLMKAGYDLGSGAERVLTAAAVAAGKPVSGLETPEQQLDYFDTLPEAAQTAFLTTTVEDLPRARELVDGMMDAWAGGDTDGLVETLNRAFVRTPELSERLLNRRNANWAQWIRQRLAKPGVVFLAVGAGHLVGDQSVQRKLAASGVKSSRMRPTKASRANSPKGNAR